MAAAKFSAQWWNDEAHARGNRLTKADIQALTGQNFDTIPQPGQEINAPGAVVNWVSRVSSEAPGFRASGLLVKADFILTTYPSGNARTNPAGWADFPSHNYFVSPVGFVAPGATAPWTPTLTTTPPPAPPPTPWYDVPDDVRPVGWVSFGAPSWPSSGETLFVDPDDLHLWQIAAITYPPVAPAEGVWIDIANNRIVRRLQPGDPIIAGTTPPPKTPPPNGGPVTTVIPEDDGEGPPPPVNGFVPSPTDGFIPEEPTDEGVPVSAGAGLGVGAGLGLMLGGGAVLLFLLTRDKRSR